MLIDGDTQLSPLCSQEGQVREWRHQETRDRHKRSGVSHADPSVNYNKVLGRHQCIAMSLNITRFSKRLVEDS